MYAKKLRKFLLDFVYWFKFWKWILKFKALGWTFQELIDGSYAHIPKSGKGKNSWSSSLMDGGSKFPMNTMLSMLLKLLRWMSWKRLNFVHLHIEWKKIHQLLFSKFKTSSKNVTLFLLFNLFSFLMKWYNSFWKVGIKFNESIIFMFLRQQIWLSFWIHAISTLHLVICIWRCTNTNI